MDFYQSSKPWTRWWWFSGPIAEADIRFQLDWLKDSGFGGVEIAWVYPLKGSKPGPAWLSKKWSKVVTYAKQYADSIGLGCDFTFGSRWPFGGSIVPKGDAMRVYGGFSGQRLELSWEDPFLDERPYILNHLDKSALERYSRIMGDALSEALKGSTSALFCDSWEVQTEGMWTDGFGEAFHDRYGYSISEHMDKLDEYPDVRYDYRKLIAEYVLNQFYKPFTEICHSLSAFSRVQCHGSPTDLLAAYASVDVPETEAVLFEPNFALITASAAALSGKKIVSAETFTCLYGWMPPPGPSPYQGQEQVADMKLVADALFANGVNFIVWHGMPYNPKGASNRFYATVHVGPDSGFADEIPSFNNYMQKVSGYMRMGKAYSDVAVYLPLEDTWMLNRLPANSNLPPDANYHWELRYIKFPSELSGYHPTWISRPFLGQSKYDGNLLHCGDATFSSLYVDVEWLDEDALLELLRLGREGLPICLKRMPQQPGREKSRAYDRDIAELVSLPNVSSDFKKIHINPPLVARDNLPDFRCRVTDEGYLLFFANPKTKDLHYPLKYGQSYSDETTEMPVEINVGATKVGTNLAFKPYRSILLRISKDGAISFTDIAFQPKVPVVK